MNNKEKDFKKIMEALKKALIRVRARLVLFFMFKSEFENVTFEDLEGVLEQKLAERLGLI